MSESYPHIISNLFIDALNFCGFNQMVDSVTPQQEMTMCSTYLPPASPLDGT